MHFQNRSAAHVVGCSLKVYFRMSLLEMPSNLTPSKDFTTFFWSKYLRIHKVHAFFDYRNMDDEIWLYLDPGIYENVDLYRHIIPLFKILFKLLYNDNHYYNYHSFFFNGELFIFSLHALPLPLLSVSPLYVWHVSLSLSPSLNYQLKW